MDKATQNKRKKDTSYHPETHVRDVNSRDIFKNNILASQFLKNYTNIPIFTNITPEDVEDITSKYRAFLGIEYVRGKDGTLEREIHTGFYVSGDRCQ